jgi:hypothetical protein
MSDEGRLNVTGLFPGKVVPASVSGASATTAGPEFAMAAARADGKFQGESAVEEVAEGDEPERERGERRVDWECPLAASAGVRGVEECFLHAASFA